ncbi:hypothetical protein [Candidatus Poriferisocius sp.]|uniref:hypothetical protein n=1 Tax=Candidatus Poriferisocius sp. TaxID=3101276 RepID=UPI003B028003
MTGRPSAEEHGTQLGAIPQGIHLPTLQKHQRKALKEFLDDWAKESGVPDPQDVAAMRRRYFPR